jgi:hypothetical protein
MPGTVKTFQKKKWLQRPTKLSQGGGALYMAFYLEK